MARLPQFETDLQVVEAMVTEQSVFCLPGKVGGAVGGGKGRKWERPRKVLADVEGKRKRERGVHQVKVVIGWRHMRFAHIRNVSVNVSYINVLSAHGCIITNEET